ncbi:MAG: hypothetical protein PWP65_744 [Clostridia bacterium]|nr:hypothetical protein [Clostridia bacterium]
MVARILKAIDQVAASYHQLVLVVAPSGAGKTAALQEVTGRRGHPYVNVNLELSRAMLELTQVQRCLHASRLIEEIVAKAGGSCILLDNLELLFDISLKQDPLRLLQQLSRHRTVVAAWNGVIKEAHRLGGSTDEVARFKLGQGLAAAAPYLLLLSATPHQGKTDAFHRLLSLLDPEAFPDQESITRERVSRYVIRTEKRRAVDLEGKPLFKPRQTRLLPVSWEERHREQRLLYEAITEYVRQGYNQAVREKKNYLGFLMILMQRLVTSSTRAIRTALERRLEVLSAPAEYLPLFPETSAEEWADLDGEEQMDLLLPSRQQALKNERAEVKTLLEAAKRTEAAGPDAKAEALLRLIYRLQQEEVDPELKVLIFTEFVPTQEMLRDFPRERGFSVVCLNGSMDLEERQKVQEAFAQDAQILISTDAGGEGMNLQFCHVVANYDIPWNPMRLEQRIGRVDRIGQKKVIRAVNFVLEGTVEHRVQEVLEEELG